MDHSAGRPVRRLDGVFSSALSVIARSPRPTQKIRHIQGREYELPVSEIRYAIFAVSARRNCGQSRASSKGIYLVEGSIRWSADLIETVTSHSAKLP